MSEGRPKQIGPYEVENLLGRGDFAEVYAAVLDDEAVALKWASTGKGASARLGNEVSVLKELDYKGLPRYLNDGVEDARPYVAMSMAPGATMAQLLADREKAGGAHGHMETLLFLRGLLQPLCHLHERGFVHRDIKAANVLCTPSMSRVTLIDFGFAKADGETETRVDDSFWRAGAARYSPPEKLHRPGRALARHDVFAVGVLAYQMLTGTWPWNLVVDREVGELREQMLSEPAKSVRERNSLVDLDVSRFVMELLNVNDKSRPGSAEALEGVEKLLENRAQREPAGWDRDAPPSFPRVVRDPLYGDVRLTDYERTVLNTREMQRLRYIRQLGLTNLVYPGAEHTRLAHAIGCVFRTEQMLRSIEDISGVRIENDTRLVARIYALVHDVTHVAFGHTIEDELGIFDRHDDNRRRIDRLVLSSTSELGEVLRQNPEGQAALSHFDEEASIQARSEIADLISGSTGADVLDYIDRDAYHCGLDHRIDSAIFRQLRLQSSGARGGERLVSLLYGSEGVRIDREYAVESLLAERYAMFLKIYCHKRKNAASAVLDKALSTAIWGGRSGARPGLEEPDYEWLPDDVVIHRLAASSRRSVKRAAERLIRRRLPQGIYRAQLLESKSDQSYEDRRHELRQKGLFDPAERLRITRELAKAANIEADEVFLYCPPKAPGYQRVSHWLSRSPGTEERADDVEAALREIKVRHLGLWDIWVFCGLGDDQSREALAAAAEDQLGFTNRIAINPRSDRLF